MTLQLTLDANALKVKDMQTLERARTVGDLAAWFVKFGGVTPEQVGELTLLELRELGAQVGETLGAAFALPKANAGS